MINEELIGSCWCDICEDYDVVIEVEESSYYVWCHDTAYEYNPQMHGNIRKKIFPINFHLRSGHQEYA